MSIKPGDKIAVVGYTVGSTGASTAADTTPTAELLRCPLSTGVLAVDGAVTVTVGTPLATGIYPVTCTVPSGYLPGDTIIIQFTATVAGITSSAALLVDNIVGLRLNDVATGTAVNLPSPVLTSADHTAIQADATAALVALGYTSTLATALAAQATSLARLLGLEGDNTGVKVTANDVTSGQPTAYDLYVYDTAAHATTNDGATGLLYHYSCSAVYTSGKLTSQVTTRIV